MKVVLRKVTLFFFISFLVAGILSDFVATDLPLYVKGENGVSFPAFTSLFKKTPAENYESAGKIIYAPIPYSSLTMDTDFQGYTPPGSKHLLGTNKLGQDVLSGLLHGMKVTLLIGILATFLAAIIGVFLGAWAGFSGNIGFAINPFGWMGLVVGVFLGYFYGFIVRSSSLITSANEGVFSFSIQVLISLGLFIIIVIISTKSGRKLGDKAGQKKSYFPVDAAITRLQELFNSLPGLLLLLALSAILHEKSVAVVILLIGLSSWPGIARLTRAEFIKNKALTYSEAALALGYSKARIIIFHILPNTFSGLSVVLLYTLSHAILAESSLSFLGLGLPDEYVTWGSLISMGRENIEAWWLLVFPGLALIFTLYFLNRWTEDFRRKS